MCEFLFPLSFLYQTYLYIFLFPLPFKWRRMISPLIRLRRIHLARPYIIFSSLFIVFPGSFVFANTSLGLQLLHVREMRNGAGIVPRNVQNLKQPERHVNNNSEQQSGK
jgi:hypothetical protein